MNLSKIIPIFGAGVLAGCGISLLIDKLFFSKKSKNEENEQNHQLFNLKYQIPEPLAFTNRQYKVVVGIRTDLKFKLYQNASILGDVVIKAVKNAIDSGNESLPPWYYFGQAKICAKVPNIEELNNLIENAKQNNVPFVTIEQDGVPCAIALGPSPVEVVDPISRHLKLL
ncbi:peptidyl-tRNA hydrolase 2, precursor [Tritrichomonas foetus]|uniref:peptidyl-tRNA hydrolase n=1 Tax=Tritrichomonas foetus TaxID=1144522 RepID=A0A1J4KEK7_9EUKA|nr:peptidyl-tRNA hydrolase 2, precursor [Tritrichomonas foetus]|eukprot:OHT09873.1 peptidyl-tRNA hydrolase 2, precursor [Tritrichomonas foetus]